MCLGGGDGGGWVVEEEMGGGEKIEGGECLGGDGWDG